ncbi:ABC transporter permease [Glaciimonas sp. PCH181]|uniref:ABC transporter permease n=1 Tax=Glaciimonas sp. PCH181 TaxID=2133943 RepID=UPI000D3A88ED|nr:ABC transporter permease [Glaciimonas sp. PCH181]PUA18700.1 ABC transporter permease [Glaciimonas sp. PCH181]
MNRLSSSVKRYPGAWIGAVGLLLLLALALGADSLTGANPLDMVARPYLWPGQEHAYPLGTDMLGRDIWSGITHGARVSLRIGLQAGLLASGIGLLVGCAAGYFGGRIDNLLMRVTELFQVMPSLIFTLVLVVILKPTVASITLGIAATSWPQVARLSRGEARRLKRSDFIEAALVMGMGDLRIIFTHILPNALMPVIALLALLVGHAILTEAAIAFLGLGDPNVVSWGSMIGSGRDELRTAWYMTAEPGAAILLTVAALNLLSSGLNQWLNPRSGSLR